LTTPPSDDKPRRSKMPARTICLVVLALVCLAAAYRFGSHGIVLNDNFCLGLAGVAIALAVGLLGIEVWMRKP